jgi:thiol:disulfide interchange protein
MRGSARPRRLTLERRRDQADGVTRRRLLVLGLVLALAHGPAAAYDSSPIFLYFTADWCAPCHALDEVLEEREVRERLRELIKVRIAPDDGDEEEEIFVEEFGGHSFPTLFLVSPSGKRRRLSHGRESLLRQLP